MLLAAWICSCFLRGFAGVASLRDVFAFCVDSQVLLAPLRVVMLSLPCWPRLFQVGLLVSTCRAPFLWGVEPLLTGVVALLLFDLLGL